MKVIVAGFSKTGTKSIAEALRQLGYNVYDFMEHYWEHGQFWFELFQKGKTVEDFKKLYENIDVVVDIPASMFWEEISEAFPDAKIILSVREESVAIKSLRKHLAKSYYNWLEWIIAVTCPSQSRFVRYFQYVIPFAYGLEYRSPWEGIVLNEMLLAKRFRQHNSYVQQKVPKEKLLVFNVEQGWAPICEFLQKEVPTTDFPWLNKDGSYVTNWIEEHGMTKIIKKEFLMFLISAFVCLAGIVIYFISR